MGTSKKSYRWVAYGILLIALQVLAVLPYTKTNYLIMDPAEAVYQTKALAVGQVPYRDIVTHHFLGYLLPLLVVEQAAVVASARSEDP